MTDASNVLPFPPREDRIDRGQPDDGQETPTGLRVASTAGVSVTASGYARAAVTGAQFANPVPDRDRAYADALHATAELIVDAAARRYRSHREARHARLAVKHLLAIVREYRAD